MAYRCRFCGWSCKGTCPQAKAALVRRTAALQAEARKRAKGPPSPGSLAGRELAERLADPTQAEAILSKLFG